MPRTQGMAAARHQFLAGTGLAVDQQRRVERRHALRTGLQGADRLGIAEEHLEPLGMVMVQGSQALADAVRFVEGQQAAGQVPLALARPFGDRRGIEQQGLAHECHFAQRQAEALLDQRILQGFIVEQAGQPLAGRVASAALAEGRVGQQHQALAVHRQHRIGHRRQQRIELQAAALAGKDVDHGHRLHATDAQQRCAQFLQHFGTEGRRVDVDVRRHHFHRVQVQVAPAQQRQHLLGDADTVDEGDVDAHAGTWTAATLAIKPSIVRPGAAQPKGPASGYGRSASCGGSSRPRRPSRFRSPALGPAAAGRPSTSSASASSQVVEMSGSTRTHWPSRISSSDDLVQVLVHQVRSSCRRSRPLSSRPPRTLSTAPVQLPSGLGGTRASALQRSQRQSSYSSHKAALFGAWATTQAKSASVPAKRPRASGCTAGRRRSG